MTCSCINRGCFSLTQDQEALAEVARSPTQRWRQSSREMVAGRHWVDGSRAPERQRGVAGLCSLVTDGFYLPVSIVPTALTIQHFKEGGSVEEGIGNLRQKEKHPFASEQTAFLCLGSFCVVWI